MNLNILVVEDLFDAAKLLKEILETDNHFVITAGDKESALSAISLNPDNIDVVILDLHIPAKKMEVANESNGFQTLEIIKKEFPHIEVIVLTAYEDVNLAVRAIKLRAYDFMIKPPKLEILKDKLNKIATLLQMEREYIELKRREKYSYIIGNSKGIQNILKLIDKVADSNAFILIEGETGTGKELIARAIHEESKRKKNPFITLNCAAIPNELLESEFFGHEKGAFTGAVEKKIGRFESANGGTLFLDEIGEMKYELQAKILRVLETQKIIRVGGTQEIEVNVRIVSATNKHIAQEVKEGKFREDLFYRLNHVSIVMPLLKNRKSDIPILAKYFLDNYCTSRGIPKKELSKSAIEMLINYNWPGNIRQLKRVIEVSILLNAEKELLDATDLEVEKEQFKSKSLDFDDLFYLPFKEAKEQFEIKYLNYLLSTSNTQAEVAKKAEIDRSNLNKLIKKYNLTLD